MEDGGQADPAEQVEVVSEGAGWDIVRGTTVCTPAEALAILGLYLRAQDDYSLMPRHRMNRSFFFWVGTRELLSEGW